MIRRQRNMFECRNLHFVAFIVCVVCSFCSVYHFFVSFLHKNSLRFCSPLAVVLCADPAMIRRDSLCLGRLLLCAVLVALAAPTVSGTPPFHSAVGGPALT